MKNQFKSQRGAIDIILILVVLVLVLGFGGYVYYRQQQNNLTYTASQNGTTVNKQSSNATAVRDNVKAFYKLWLSPPRPSEDPTYYVGKGYLSAKGATAISRAQDSDVVSCSQNPLEPGQYKYDLPTFNGTTGSMTVSGVYAGPPAYTNVIKLDLVKSNNKWLIDDFHCPTNEAAAATADGSQYVNGATFTLDKSVGNILQWNLTAENVNISSDTLLAKEKELYGSTTLDCVAQEFPLGRISVKDSSTPYPGYSLVKKLDSGSYLFYEKAALDGTNSCYTNRPKLDTMISQQAGLIATALKSAH